MFAFLGLNISEIMVLLIGSAAVVTAVVVVVLVLLVTSRRDRGYHHAARTRHKPSSIHNHLATTNQRDTEDTEGRITERTTTKESIWRARPMGAA
jgi:hypothetical protein